MKNFDDVIQEYEKIKGTPEVTDGLRVKSNISKGLSADSIDRRQQFLPSKETHYKLQQKLSQMFDKSSRAGAKLAPNAKSHGLIMPNGQKMFSEFHDRFTGTGRFTPQKPPDKVVFDDNAPKVDPYPHRVQFYERCLDCFERVDLDNFIPNMVFIPSGEALNPVAREKWASVDIKPGTLLCYFFCMKCPTDKAMKLSKIKHDSIKSTLIIGVGPDGKPITVADKECQEFLAEHAARISDNVHSQIKYHRDIRTEGVFYGNARID